MASIVKRKNRYSVVYTYKDDDGNQHQKWEPFDTNADAKKRKTQIEFEQQSGTFIIPNATTVADLLEEYCSVYGVNNWAMSTYRSKKGLMYNYIIPLIGDVKLDELTPRLMDKFYQSLLKVKTKVVQNKKPKNEYLTVHTVREIHKFLRSAFNQAVKWELMTRNPVLNATLPKEEHQKREIWTAETLMHALEVCDDDILALAINLSFACSLRMGEMLGLTWDCIDISEESLKENNASIFVDKELQRVNRDVMEVLDNKDIIRVFPRTLSNTNTSLVLKTPKTKTSVRKIFLPSTVAQMLLERKNAYKALEPGGSKWHIHGWFCLIGCYLLMMYYTTVSGWMVDYFFRFLTGSFDGLTSEQAAGVFGEMLSNPVEMVFWMAVITLAGFVVCGRGLQGGLEKVGKWMMSALLVLILVLVVHSFTLSGAGEGLAFYLLPDWSRATGQGLGNVITAAMNQSFFTLSLGIGAIEIFGSTACVGL